MLSDHDKDICGFGWRNYYIRGKTVAKALRRTWREFYSDITTNKRGQAVHTLYPANTANTQAIRNLGTPALACTAWKPNSKIHHGADRSRYWVPRTTT